MTGILKIHPDSKTVVTSSTTDNIGSTDHVLLSADLKENERRKILYSKGRLNASVIGSEESAVTVQLRFLIGGTSVHDAHENARQLSKAFSNFSGGYIEYRPTGYGNNILTTWYRYLMSPPPRQLDVSSTHQGPSESYSLGIVLEYNVEILSLATSNPFSKVTDVTPSATVWTYTDSAELGYMTVPESDIKGDGLFPEIHVRGVDSGDIGPSSLILSFHETESGAEDSVWRSEHVTSSDSGNVTYDSTDRYRPTSPATSFWVQWPHQTDSFFLMGRVAPVFSYKVADTTHEWQARMIFSRAGFLSYPMSEWTDIPNTELGKHGDDAIWKIMIMDSIGLPPLQFPATEALSRLKSHIGIEIREKNASASTLHIYGLVLYPVGGNSWIAKFSEGPGAQNLESDLGLVVNVGAKMHYTESIALDEISRSWIKQGQSISDAIMPKARYEVRCITRLGYTLVFPEPGWQHKYAGGPADNKVTISIHGIFYTVYPFAEA